MYVVSRACIEYLRLELKWIRAGRPDEIADRLDGLWHAMTEGPNLVNDLKFINNRGPIIHDEQQEDVVSPHVDFDSSKGNGFCAKWLTAYDEQILGKRAGT